MGNLQQLSMMSWAFATTEPTEGPILDCIARCALSLWSAPDQGSTAAVTLHDSEMSFNGVSDAHGVVWALWKSDFTNCVHSRLPSELRTGSARPGLPNVAGWRTLFQ